MKTLLASTALALLATGPLMAEQHMGAGTFVEQSAEGDIYGSNLIGMRLYVSETEIDESMSATADARAEWDDVGEINDVLISDEGDVKAVLLDIGGFLGMGEKTIAVDMSSLNFLRDGDNPDDVFIAMQGTEESLEGAPEFERADMTEMDTMDEASAEGTMDNASTEGSDEMAATEANNDNVAVEGEDTAAMESADEPVAAEGAEDTAAVEGASTDAGNDAEMAASGDQMDAWDRPAIEREGYQTVEATDLTAEDLEGATLYGANDDSIGDVEDLIVTTDGQIEQAIVDVGGFLGLGERRIAIGFEELQVVRSDDGGDTRVYVSATEEQLEGRPEYEG